MPMILSGGGGYEKNPDAYELFFKSVDRTKPVLYICFANLPDTFVASYGKFTAMMASHGIYCTRLCNDISVFDEFFPDGIGGIYCAGGNTFRLLKILKESGGDKKIIDFVRNGGAYIGSSAGAIIAGSDIQPITFMDANAVVLKDTSGLDMMRGYATIAHYGDAATELKNSEWYASTEALASDYPRLIALSEEAAIVIDGDHASVLGADTLVYENGEKRIIPNGGLLF
ncbi:MAG: Type 1 glutamine amidotransferase-like domain-containing protein [Clostridia bacterium]|nr:Type 1 glutamine amidotransferase-like domain-containing protein [Clostridia bacterium]